MKRRHSTKIIIEIPTYPYAGEFRDTLLGRLKLSVDYLLRSAFCALVDVWINSSSTKQIFGRRTIHVPNGFDPEEIGDRGDRAKNSRDGDVLHLLYVGYLAAWQGVDRAISAMAGARSRSAHLHVVGDGPEMEYSKRLVDEMGLADRVTLHGHLDGEELDQFFDLADVGLCSMAIDRKSMSQLSALKTVEYAARGLPFLLNYHDTNFEEDLPFVIRVPSGHVPSPDALLDELRIRRTRHGDLSEIARAYARHHLTWEACMRPVLDYLNERD